MHEKIICIFKLFPTNEIKEQYKQHGINLNMYITSLYARKYDFISCTDMWINHELYGLGCNFYDENDNKINKYYTSYVPDKLESKLRDIDCKSEKFPDEAKHLLVPTIFPIDKVEQEKFMMHYEAWKYIVDRELKNHRRITIALKLIKEIMDSSQLEDSHEKFFESHGC